MSEAVFEGFHVHQLRHTFTSNLLSNGAAPKDVQELFMVADLRKMQENQWVSEIRIDKQGFVEIK